MSCRKSKSFLPDLELSGDEVRKSKESGESKNKSDEKFPVWLILVFVLLGILLLMWLWPKITGKNKKDEKINEFVITYLPKDHHPWKATGSDKGFAINGIEGATLNLKKGQKYRFTYASPAGSEPFYFTTSNSGGIGDSNKIPGSPEPFDSGSRIIVFDNKYPSTFFYQSSNSPRAGGVINLA